MLLCPLQLNSYWICQFTYNTCLSLSLSIIHIQLVKEKILQKCLHRRQKNYVRRRKKIYLSPLLYLLKRYVRQEARINWIAKNTGRNGSRGWCGCSSKCCRGRALSSGKSYADILQVIWFHVLVDFMYYMKSYNWWISSVTHHLHQIITQILVPQFKSNWKIPPEDLGEEDGMIGAADDAEEDHQVVSYSLTSYKIYKFMY